MFLFFKREFINKNVNKKNKMLTFSTFFAYNSNVFIRWGDVYEGIRL